jgi:Protein of unknown function (DUF3047)
MRARRGGRPGPKALAVVGLLVVAGVATLVWLPRGPEPPRRQTAPAAVRTPGRMAPAATIPTAVHGPAAAVASIRVPEADTTGRVLVPVADLVPARLPAAGVPAGWGVTEFAGSDPAVELGRMDGRVALRLRSEQNSFALHRDLALDVEQYPILTWSWNVTRLPTDGDVRDPERNDQAAQVYVVFPRWPAPRTNSDVLGYVWDSRAPVGTALSHPRAPNVRIIVVESGPDRLDTWVRERRDVAEDYRALFGRRPPRAGKLAVMIDTNDTRSGAEAWFGDLAFARPDVPADTEIPTTMLR